VEKSCPISFLNFQHSQALPCPPSPWRSANEQRPLLAIETPPGIILQANTEAACVRIPHRPAPGRAPHTTNTLLSIRSHRATIGARAIVMRWRQPGNSRWQAPVAPPEISACALLPADSSVVIVSKLGQPPPHCAYPVRGYYRSCTKVCTKGQCEGLRHRARWRGWAFDAPRQSYRHHLHSSSRVASHALIASVVVQFSSGWLLSSPVPCSSIPGAWATGSLNRCAAAATRSFG
jgi:hypothetical protein